MTKVMTYDKEHCWQYEIRTRNLQDDLFSAILRLSNPKDLFTPSIEITEQELRSLSVSDFVLSYEEKQASFAEVKSFIERHEWLAQMSHRPTHLFTARFEGLLCGVVVMDMPNAFSKIMGEETHKIERLISRGACISYSPKNLASSLVMYAVRWMSKNTDYRLFTAYSDPEAKELGTIYQACNFYYLGQSFGAARQYQIENGRWVSDRYFRCRSVYKRLAKSANIGWDKSWQDGDKVFFSKMPDDIQRKLRELSRDYMNRCENRDKMPKHKYAYVQGKSKSETRRLRKLFSSMNNALPYPTNRGYCQ
jgi:hypothetical protein